MITMMTAVAAAAAAAASNCAAVNISPVERQLKPHLDTLFEF